MPQKPRVYGRAIARSRPRYLRRLRKQIFDDVIAVLHAVDPELTPVQQADAELGQVKDFGSLAQSSQREGVPLWMSSGVNPQKDEAKAAFDGLAKHIVEVTRGGTKVRRGGKHGALN